MKKLTLEELKDIHAKMTKLHDEHPNLKKGSDEAKEFEKQICDIFKSYGIECDSANKILLYLFKYFGMYLLPSLSLFVFQIILILEKCFSFGHFCNCSWWLILSPMLISLLCDLIFPNKDKEVK